MVKKVPSDKQELSFGTRWDKLRTWHLLKDEIEAKCQEPEKFDCGITIDIGPQLLQTLRHRSLLRCVNHVNTKLGEVFTTHYNKGAVQRISVWLLESKSKESVSKHVWFETQYELTSLIYVAKHRVYCSFCTDLCLRIFTDANSNFSETFEVPCTSTVLCLVYNRDEDEIYAGGVGFLDEWKITGAEHAASLVPGKKFITDITRNDWVRDIRIDKRNNQMFAMHGNGIIVVNFKTRKQTHRLANRHEGPLKCCCIFPQNDYLITGGADGKIKVFNGTAFNFIHVIIGHHGPVTSVEPHRKDNLLLSCSLDGTVRLWKMDSFTLFTRVDIGEGLYHLALLGDTEFFFRTEKEIMIYTLNQFYQFFAPVESETYKLICCRGRGKPNRILASTEDGSVRLFSPVTGLTLTIIYPMPTFQILTEFAYDLHQDRLYTVLNDGRVVIYNTDTNPCKCEEMWVPACQDEQVTNLLLVTVEFQCDDGTDVDNLVFAGLNNGQIILCEALVCALELPVQAHEGALTCFHASSQSIQACSLSSGCNTMIVSGGTDNFVKIWLIVIDSTTRRPLVNLALILKILLPAVPTQLCMYDDILALSLQVMTYLGCRWRLVMYRLSCSGRDSWQGGVSQGGGMIMPLQECHQPDEDHCLEMTAIDKCPPLKLFLTAGKDGFVKIWSKENQLIREMNFATPIYASCFANDRGDILIGYGTHVCSVSVVNYLPVDNLRRLIHTAFKKVKDDGRELPVNFDHSVTPRLDLDKVRKYPVDILERRKQKIEEEVIEKLKKATEKVSAEKFVIFVDGGTTRVIRKDFADRLVNWAKGKNKFKLGIKSVAQSSATDTVEETEEINLAGKKSVTRKFGHQINRDGTSEEVDGVEGKDSVDWRKQSLVHPSAIAEALRQLETFYPLGPFEMKLLEDKKIMERDPIIAPDGYIPNSVIRSKLKPPQREPLHRKLERRWKVKPVPKSKPEHMPLGWEIGVKEPTPFLDSSTSITDRVRYISASPKFPGQDSTEDIPLEPDDSQYQMKSSDTQTYKLRSKLIELRPEKDMVDYMKKKRKSGIDKKSLKLTGLAVDEDSSAILVKDAKADRKGFMELELVQQLLGEKWMPQLEGSFEYDDVLSNLISILNNDNPMIYDSVITYLTKLFKQLGMSDALLDECIAKMASNLEHLNIAIRRHTLRGMQALGLGRADVLTMVLPKLVDTEEAVRKAAGHAMLLLTGANDKETLLNYLDQLGITGGWYNSKDDEQYTFRELAERFGDWSEDPAHIDRIQDWVEGTTPGMIDEDMNPEDLDQLWKDGARSRKSSMYKSREQSFMSEKSGRRASKGSTSHSTKTSTGSRSRAPYKVVDAQQSTRAPRTLTGGTSRASRASGRFTPKDPLLYKHYGQEAKLAPGYQEDGKKVPGEDSGYKTISQIPSSQIMERLSGQDSGISRDMSEFSHRGKGYPYGAPLSPVKSEDSLSTDKKHTKDWRKFFELPTAIERHQMELIKHEMAQGKLKQTTLPPICYFAEDLPMLPGEAGTRLLQTVRVGEKVSTSGDGRHRIEPVPGKLAVHTQNESAGLASFGIIQMQWTTGVPTVKDLTHPPQRIPQRRAHLDDSEYLPPLQSPLTRLSRIRHGSSDVDLHLPNLTTASPTVSHRLSPSFEWELPLPPPPAKESRTNIPHIKQQHDTYCKYYQLVKKKLHLYTSKQQGKGLSLPTVVVKGMTEKQTSSSRETSPKIRKSREPSKLVMGNGHMLPPIKLGQLINI